MRSRISIVLSVSVLAWVCVSTLAVPSIAIANNYRGECRKLTRQISHFGDVADTARARKDRLWLNSTNQHIRALTDRRANLCPDLWSPPPRYQWMDDFKRLAKLAAKGAVRYFTFGVY